MKTLIRNATIIPMAGRDAHSLSGSIGITDSLISFVGDAPDDFRPDTTIDGTGYIVMPGLVNAHNHLSMTLLRNYADDMDLFTWLNEKIWPVEAKLTKDDIYWGSMLGAAEQIRSGITSFADMYFHQEETVKAIAAAGIRGSISATFFGDRDDTDSRISETISLHERYHDSSDGRISIDIAPHAIYTCTDYTLRKSAEIATQLGCRIHTHISESRKEHEECIASHGMTPLAYLETMGLLELPVYAAHAVYLDDDDIALAKKHKVSLVHNPTSNLKLGNGFAPVEKFLDAGLTVALGTDGASSNNNLNLFEEMHITSLIHKGFSGDPTMLSAYEVLRMATINGARALGIDGRTGSIEPGKEADLILIDTRVPHLQPVGDPVSAVVYSAQASDVDTVFCQGRMLMQGRKLMTLDEEEIITNAAAAAARLTRTP